MEGVVGIDLGGTGTKFGLLTRDGTLLASGCIPTNSALPYKIFFRKLYDEILKLKEKLDEDIDLVGIGVGAPTGNYFSGALENASNLDWTGKVPVTEVLGTYSNLPTVLINDANAAAVGEMLYGAAQGVENFIFITLGTGLGSGIVANGKLVIGYNGHAGELGHTTVYFNGRPCKCGRKGCLETYVSAPGLVYTIKELMKSSDTQSKLRDIPENKLNAEKITHAALNNDSLALEAFEYTGRIFGLKLADIVALMNPEVIVVSGGLAKAGSLILEPTRRAMEDHMLSVFKKGVDIRLSSLTEENGAILGAAAFAWQELENQIRYKKMVQ